MTTFAELDLIAPILQSLSEEGYATPTPIQAQSIPIILTGKDLLGCAQTGTGKTAAFAIPILQLLSESRSHETIIPKKYIRKIRSLIVTPTRELAIQIQESFAAYGRHLHLRTAVVFGGVGQGSQVNTLQKGVDILIATPGRLIDLIGQGYISLSDIEIFVLDEADRMLDMGFVHDVRRLVALLPKKRQSLFFSATMPPEIVTLAHTILVDPARVTVTPVSSTAEIISQHVYHVDRGNKIDLLKFILKNQNIKTVLVFTRTKHGADKVVRKLIEHNITAEAIHGNKSQNARQRALGNFKEQTTRVLVATDIAARGIDVDELAYVVNYEMPDVAETYVHRIGRTGRAGASGTAFSFCDAEEMDLLRDIERLIAKSIPRIEDHPWPLTDMSPTPSPELHRGSGKKPSPSRSPRAKSPTEKSPTRTSEPSREKRTPIAPSRSYEEKKESPKNSKYPPVNPGGEQRSEEKRYDSPRTPLARTRSPEGYSPRTPSTSQSARPPKHEKYGVPIKGADSRSKSYDKSEFPKEGEQMSWRKTTKRAERSWSKNKERLTDGATTPHRKRAPAPKKPLDTPKPPVSKNPPEKKQIDEYRSERTRSPRAKKPNPKPFIPKAPKRWREDK